MLIKQNKYFFAICAFLMVCLAAGSSSTSLRGDVKRYEVRPEITVPEYKTDIARIVDAYERLMDNYITLTENNLATTRMEIGDITKKLDTIDQKITDLSRKRNSAFDDRENET